MRKLFLLVFSLFFVIHLLCQEDSKIGTEKRLPQIENLEEKSDFPLPEFIKSDSLKIQRSMTAAALSFLLPGGGQIYNHKYSKGAFVFSIESSLIGLSVSHYNNAEDHRDKYKKYKELYNETQNMDYYQQYSKHRSKYVKYRTAFQSDLWWIGSVVFLSTIDAYIDAKSYDIPQSGIKLIQDKTKKPFLAATLSFFIPGGGQFYNENYIKSASVFALEGTLVGLAIFHYSESNRYYDKSEKAEQQNLLVESQYYYNQYVNYYEKQQSDLWWLGTVIFLSTIDAFVDAHLFDYEDRKNKIHLKFEDNMIGLQYNF